jgi:hypothetical protein
VADLLTSTGIELDKTTTQAIVGHMLKDRSFAEKVMTQLKFNQFPGLLSEIVFVIDELCKNPDYTHLVFNSAVVFKYLVERKGNIQDQFKYQNEFAECDRLADVHPIEIVSDYLEGWLSKITAIDFANKLAQHVNKSDYKAIKPHVQKMSDTINDIVFRDVTDASDNFKGLYESYLKQDDNKAEHNCTTGHPLFDEMLVKGSLLPTTKTFKSHDHFKKNESILGAGELLVEQTMGGLIVGGSTVVLGTVNSGKTTTLCTIAAANAMMGKSVLLITLEQAADEIRDKIVSNILNKSNFEMRRLCQTVKGMGGPHKAAAENPELKNFLYSMAMVEATVSKQITHIHHNKSSQMTMEHVNYLLNQAIVKRKRATGKGFDLVMIDYPARLRSPAFGKNGQRHDELTMIYQNFIDHAREHQYHTILPVQTNRDGYKVNQGINGTGRMLDMGDAAGAFGIIQAADQVISINRTPTDRQADLIRYMIVKNRAGATDRVFASKTNMDHSQAFGIYLPAVTFDYNTQVDSQAIARWIGESALQGTALDKRSEQSLSELREKVDIELRDKQTAITFEANLAEIEAEKTKTVTTPSELPPEEECPF